MDIVSRIKIFLDSRNFDNSQFADKCEIPRPTVSQLLNGRNKKVSDEIISKIHAAYPELSIMWLMFGEEPMINDQNTTNYGNNPKLPENRINVTESDNSSNYSNLARQDEMRILFSEREAPKEIGTSENDSTPISRALETIARNNGRPASASEKNGNKHIVNVMVFYSDNSFVSFVPEQPE